MPRPAIPGLNAGSGWARVTAGPASVRSRDTGAAEFRPALAGSFPDDLRSEIYASKYCRHFGYADRLSA
jgi:hypothetical protein